MYQFTIHYLQLIVITFDCIAMLLLLGFELHENDAILGLIEVNEKKRTLFRIYHNSIVSNVPFFRLLIAKYEKSSSQSKSFVLIVSGKGN